MRREGGRRKDAQPARGSWMLPKSNAKSCLLHMWQRLPRTSRRPRPRPGPPQAPCNVSYLGKILATTQKKRRDWQLENNSQKNTHTHEKKKKKQKENKKENNKSKK